MQASPHANARTHRREPNGGRTRSAAAAAALNAVQCRTRSTLTQQTMLMMGGDDECTHTGSGKRSRSRSRHACMCACACVCCVCARTNACVSLNVPAGTEASLSCRTDGRAGWPASERRECVYVVTQSLERWSFFRLGRSRCSATDRTADLGGHTYVLQWVTQVDGTTLFCGR